MVSVDDTLEAKVKGMLSAAAEGEGAGGRRRRPAAVGSLRARSIDRLDRKSIGNPLGLDRSTRSKVDRG
ncbi:MAG: hypothetical protein ACPGJJ_04545, partial [Parvibaculales bacterium]